MNELLSAVSVAEVQGLYGPFSFGEKLLQKIWLRGDFEKSAARLTDGRTLRILHPGKWNLLGGPDFKSARIAFGDGPEICGDVELHLRAVDWMTHGHARDAAYNGVVLHVVLFPPESDHVTRGAGGREIPTLALLPLLHHDLEEFAASEAIEVLAGQPAGGIPDELAVLEDEALRALLRTHAQLRWKQKVEFARRRVERLGWKAACHQTALEILGYRFNRAPMLRIAERYPLHSWTASDFASDEVFESERGRWSLQGVRPANHPRTRLTQYSIWVRQRPDWPARWFHLGAMLPDLAAAALTRGLRRDAALAQLREKIAEDVCGGALSGTRLDNLICDGLLPLNATLPGRDFFGLWFHWFPGDQPPALMRVLRQLNVFDGRSQPACHGIAQGLFSWFLQRESRLSQKGRGA